MGRLLNHVVLLFLGENKPNPSVLVCYYLGWHIETLNISFITAPTHRGTGESIKISVGVAAHHARRATPEPLSLTDSNRP